MNALGSRLLVAARLRPRPRPPEPPFLGSLDYWESRYRSDGDSGPGSFGRLADFKARVLNDFVREHDIRTVIELGCGDGNQLDLAEYPSYTGVDVSLEAIERCRARFGTDQTKRFMLLDQLGAREKAELALSLDVIYHLVEDGVLEAHFRTLDRLATRYVILYTSDGTPQVDHPVKPHVRHRPIQDDVIRLLPHWRLISHIPNPYPWDPSDPSTSFADFFVYAT